MTVIVDFGSDFVLVCEDDSWTVNFKCLCILKWKASKELCADLLPLLPDRSPAPVADDFYGDV